VRGRRAGMTFMSSFLFRYYDIFLVSPNKGQAIRTIPI
jgi:hypothetical protein